MQPGGRVVATDLSPQMVDVTRRKAQRLGLDNLEAREIDALAKMAPDTIEQMKAKVFEALPPHMRGGGAVSLAAAPLCASARRSA